MGVQTWEVGRSINSIHAPPPAFGIISCHCVIHSMNAHTAFLQFVSSELFIWPWLFFGYVSLVFLHFVLCELFSLTLFILWLCFSGVSSLRIMRVVFFDLGYSLVMFSWCFFTSCHVGCFFDLRIGSTALSHPISTICTAFVVGASPAVAYLSKLAVSCLITRLLLLVHPL